MAIRISSLFVLLILAGCGYEKGGAPITTESGSGTEESVSNLYAIHDSTSSRYRDDCTSCHSSVLKGTELDSSVTSAHATMIQHVPNGRCTYCHSTVDLLQGSAGNLRRQVSVTTCDACHGPNGPSTKQYYQK